MIVSATELTALVTRAALGSGWAPGLAAELGRATAWLSGQGDGAGLALTALGATPQQIEPDRSGPVIRFSNAPLVALGPSVFELLELDGVAAVELANIEAPGLLLGYGGVAAASFKASYDVRIDGSAFMVCPHEIISDTNDFPHQACGLSVVTRSEQRPAPITDTPPTLTVEPATWNALRKLAKKSFVASTDASRASGAGAGLTDND